MFNSFHILLNLENNIYFIHFHSFIHFNAISDDQNNETQNRNNSNKIQSTLPTNGEVNGKSDSLPTYQSIFANTLTRQQQHQQEGTVETTAAVSPISRLESGNHSNSIQNGNIQNSHIYNKSNYSPQ